MLASMNDTSSLPESLHDSTSHVYYGYHSPGWSAKVNYMRASAPHECGITYH